VDPAANQRRSRELRHAASNHLSSEQVAPNLRSVLSADGVWLANEGDRWEA
jgi:hypothetical protein